MSGNFKYYVDANEIELFTEDFFYRDNPGVLLDDDDDLSKYLGDRKSGYFVKDFSVSDDYYKLKSGVADLIYSILKKSGKKDIQNFRLEKYHEYCGEENMHRMVLSELRSLASVNNLPIDYRIIDEMVSEACLSKVTAFMPNVFAAGFFFIRIVRPSPWFDYNPPHRDVWIDRLRNAINLYVPLAGSNYKSSLSLLPGSHYLPGSAFLRTNECPTVRNVKFTVPVGLLAEGKTELIRPRVDESQMLIFSPYLLHGGSVNLNQDMTRVSLEMRLWRA